MYANILSPTSLEGMKRSAASPRTCCEVGTPPTRAFTFGERSLDQVVHSHGYLAYHAVHVDEGKQGTIHQNSRYHWDDARNGDALVRGVEPVACLDYDDADERRTGKRTDAQAHVETDVAVGWTQVDEVARSTASTLPPFRR